MKPAMDSLRLRRAGGWLLIVVLAVILAAGYLLPAGEEDYPPLAVLPALDAPGEEIVELGRLLFFDPRLSGDGSTSCASCHTPRMGWSHSDPLAPGYPGHRLWRNNPTVLNAAHFSRLMWDGTLDSLEVQARSAMQAPVEGNGKPTLIEARLRFIPEYVDRFRSVFGSEWPRLDDAWRAIAAFERTIVSDPAQVPVDRHLRGEAHALSESARRGFEVFQGKAGCIRCHHGALATDQEFHALGVPRQPLFDASPLVQIAVRWQNAQRDVPRAVHQGMDEDLGRYYRTRDPADIGKFRTPSLRELKYTAPYMHNGVFATLRDVVDFFDRGGGEAPNKSPLLQPLGLSEQEKEDLVAFLLALSMDEPLIVDPPPLPPMRAEEAQCAQ